VYCANSSKSVQAEPSQTGPNPRKKALDLLGFIRQNQAFSMGYRKSKYKNFSPAVESRQSASMATWLK
jgi:hypothetical protein